MKPSRNQSAFVAWILMLGLAVTFVPILAASFYAHPFADDYSFSDRVHHTYMAGGGILPVLQAVIHKVQAAYLGWQGTFSAIAIFAMQPGAISDDLYFLTTWMMLGALSGSTLFLLHTILVKWLSMRKSHMMIVCSGVLFLQVQFVPSIPQAFFWFNGSSYYTLFYSFALVLAALLLRVFLARTQFARVMLTMLAALVAFVIGGGNYSTGLFCICGLFLVVFMTVCKKDPRTPYMIAVFAVLISAFLINVMAPGNAVRAALMPSVSPLKAIGLSFYHALVFMGDWSNLCVTAAVLFLSPLVYLAARRCGWSFRYPLVVIGVAFGLFSCQLTPPLYAASTVGAGRQINIYYYSYVLMVLFDVFYVAGWAAKKYPDALSAAAIQKIAHAHVLPIAVGLSIFVFAGCLSYGLGNMTSGACLKALLDGSAQAYDAVISENIAKLESTQDVCFVREVENCPEIFQKTEISEDPTFWINLHHASYYGCKQVRLLVEEGGQTVE